jgi:GNAT superfamily N-acetyltransferase
MNFEIRAAEIGDIDDIYRYIHALAEYEKAPLEAVLTKADLTQSLFGDNPKAFCHLSVQDNEVTGIAIWFLNYSTWLGKHGIYLEDLFVDPKYRGQGHGKALLVKLAQICVERGYSRFSWWVLDWNKDAIDFYESIGAQAMDEWTVYRVSGDALTKLASQG